MSGVDELDDVQRNVIEIIEAKRTHYPQPPEPRWHLPCAITEEDLLRGYAAQSEVEDEDAA